MTATRAALRCQIAELDELRGVLELYAEALAGRKVGLRVVAERPSAVPRGVDLEPVAIGLGLPSRVDWFPDLESNLWFYKSSILFQLAAFEHGTYRFSMAGLTGSPVRPRQSRAMDHVRSELELFFARFDDPRRAENLFELFEGSRLERRLGERYRGLRHPLEKLRRRALEERPDLADLGPSPRALEALARRTLGAELGTEPGDGGPDGGAAAALAEVEFRHRQRDRDVHASARAVIEADRALRRLGVGDHHGGTSSEDTESSQTDLWIRVPHRGPGGFAVTQRQVELRRLAEALLADESRREESASGSAGEGLGDSFEPLRALLDAEGRGSNSLLGLLDALEAQDEDRDARGSDSGAGRGAVGTSPAAAPRTRLESASRGSSEPGATSSTGAPEDRGETPALPRDQRERRALAQALRRQIELTRDAGVFRYDEWDYLGGRYRRRWCTLREIVLADAGESFFRQALARHGAELETIQRQLELLRPTSLRRVRRLVDGEDLDLDRLVESHIDTRAGLPPSEDVHSRRDRRERDVAAVFLLDMSASTDSPLSELPPAAGSAGDEEGAGDVGVDEGLDDADRPILRYDFVDILAGLEPGRVAAVAEPEAARRVIEVEKEALALMAECLQSLGDRYAIYGFSGYGRDQVDFFVAKEFDQPFDQSARGRVGAISPKQSTRMGPAIRHAIQKLEGEEARTRVLLVLSDGYPQDCDYGEERGCPRYGIEDTTMALREARRAGIETFCLTVDPAGHDYLRQMCSESSYLVIDDVAALPAELPKVYRGLTAS